MRQCGQEEPAAVPVSTVLAPGQRWQACPSTLALSPGKVLLGLQKLLGTKLGYQTVCGAGHPAETQVPIGSVPLPHVLRNVEKEKNLGCH